MALRISSGSMSFPRQLAKAAHHPARHREETEADKKKNNVHTSLQCSPEGNECDVTKV